VQLRNSLCLQLLLTNAKRAGDVTHLRREAVLNAKSDKGSDIEVEVSTTIILEKNGYG
jgi:ketosteroid isomerase-like protein